LFGEGRVGVILRRVGLKGLGLNSKCGEAGRAVFRGRGTSEGADVGSGAESAGCFGPGGLLEYKMWIGMNKKKVKDDEHFAQFHGRD
jgi:hypothetical protein